MFAISGRARLPGPEPTGNSYGEDAEATLSQPATKVCFMTSEARAAKWISEAIGKIEVEQLKESHSIGLLRLKKS